jgi:hypothetical protein
VVGRYIWLFGEHTTEIWQDTGANFPFAPFPSTLIPYGIAAPYSAALVGNGVAWVANNPAGRRCVMYASGQSPEVISTYPLEAALSGYDDITTAVGDSYSDKGHTFYLLSIPDEPETTYVWDVETKLWHERGTWRSEENRYEAWRPRFYAFAFGEHRILDSAGSYVYRMSTDLVTDVDGLAIRRMRRAPALQAENRRIYYPYFQLDVEPGLAATPYHASFTMEAQQATYDIIGLVTVDGSTPGGTYGFDVELWHSVTDTVEALTSAPAAPDYELIDTQTGVTGDGDIAFSTVTYGVYALLATPDAGTVDLVNESEKYSATSILVDEADEDMGTLNFTAVL